MRLRSLVVSAALAAASGSSIAAQECVGIPRGGKGFLGGGPYGADGSGGTGVSFAYRGEGRSLMLDRESVGVFAHANPQKTMAVQVSHRVKRLSGCVTAGASWMSWDTEGNDSWSWSASEPDVYVIRHSVGGDYTRLRVPVGLSFGRTLDWRRVSFTPFVNPLVVFEKEGFSSNLRNPPPRQSRSTIGEGLAMGFTLRAGWFMMRPTVSSIDTRDMALSGRHNGPTSSLHIGVIY